MKLSHTTKVTVRKALAALRRANESVNADDPMTDAMGAQEFVAQDYVRRIVRKAGFRSYEELEAFAVKHRLMKEEPYVDMGFMTPPDTSSYPER